MDDAAEELPSAVLGRVWARVERATLDTAQEDLDAISSEQVRAGWSAADQAQYLAVQARLAWEQKLPARAVQRAKEALKVQSDNGLAHLVLAEWNISQGEDASAHLRSAIGAPRPSSRARRARRIAGRGGRNEMWACPSVPARGSRWFVYETDLPAAPGIVVSFDDCIQQRLEVFGTRVCCTLPYVLRGSSFSKFWPK